MQWIQFFFGTPRRLLTTVASLAALYGLAQPEVVAMAVGNLLTRLWIQLEPLFWAGVTLFIVVLGLRLMWRAITGR